MLVSELLTAIKAREDYVTNSLLLKSNDTLGGTYKWLATSDKTEMTAGRKEIFIAAEGTEGDDFTTRTVITSVEVISAH
jgi:hypothetical protein